MEICFISEATVLFGLKCWVRRVGGICHEYEKDASLRENVKERSQVHKSVQGFPGDSAHPSKIWQVPIGALAKKKKKNMHGADCHRVLLLLGQEGARLPPHGNLPVEPSLNMLRRHRWESKENSFAKEWTSLRHLKSVMKIFFAGGLPYVRRLCV